MQHDELCTVSLRCFDQIKSNINLETLRLGQDGTDKQSQNQLKFIRIKVSSVSDFVFVRPFSSQPRSFQSNVQPPPAGLHANLLFTKTKSDIGNAQNFSGKVVPCKMLAFCYCSFLMSSLICSRDHLSDKLLYLISQYFALKNTSHRQHFLIWIIL